MSVSRANTFAKGKAASQLVVTKILSILFNTRFSWLFDQVNFLLVVFSSIRSHLLIHSLKQSACFWFILPLLLSEIYLYKLKSPYQQGTLPTTHYTMQLIYVSNFPIFIREPIKHYKLPTETCFLVLDHTTHRKFLTHK
jgi:hypothetical protein